MDVAIGDSVVTGVGRCDSVSRQPVRRPRVNQVTRHDVNSMTDLQPAKPTTTTTKPLLRGGDTKGFGKGLPTYEFFIKHDIARTDNSVISCDRNPQQQHLSQPLASILNISITPPLAREHSHFP